MAQTGVQIKGAGATLSQLRGMADRCRNPEGAYQAMFRGMEAHEREVFAGHGGKYVRTGRTRDALTLPDADGAIREAHGGTFTFGAGGPVWYAKFQGTTGKGNHHDPSAILNFGSEMARAAEKGLRSFLRPRDEHGRFVRVEP